jgi:hypothetical protein
VPGGVAVAAGVHGVTGCGGGGEDLVAAEVVAGEHGAEVGRGSGTGVDILSGRELPTPPAPSKWTYSMVKLSYVRVEPLSTALSHAHPRLRRILRHASCAHAMSLGQERDRPLSPPRSR